MFRSIFSKYITAVSLIVIVSFLILTTVLTAVIGEYAKSERREEVEQAANQSAEILSYGYPEGQGLSLHDFITERSEISLFMEFLTEMERGCQLFVTDDQSRVLLSTPRMEYTAEQIISHAEHWAEIQAIVSAGGSYYATEVLEEFGGDNCLVCVVPIISPEDGYLGSVCAVTSIEVVDQITGATTQTAVMACLWIMLAVLVAVYFITERHVDPIRRMSAAARKYAHGDFTERVEPVGGDEIAELAAAINYMAEQLDSLEQKRNRFISDVSHELRSPMTSMLGFVEAVADGSCPPEKREYYLSLVAEEIKRLSRLVAELLDVSRLEMGERKMNFARYDICDNATTVLISLEQRINDKQLDVSFEAAEDKIFVRADADAMYRVLYNLIENAVKFSRERGALRVSITKGKQYARFEIYNQGIGISREDLPNIFDRFYKSDKSRGKDKKGVGLGLYFVKTIVVAHGGEITAESREGEDCLFVMKLPLAKETDGKENV